MSDVGQEFHTWSYDCESKEHPNNIDHDNAGITHTFMEVDEGVPIRWKKPEQPKNAQGMEMRSNEIGKKQEFDGEDSSHKGTNPDESDEGKTEAVVHRHTQDVSAKDDHHPFGKSPSFRVFDHDVCLRQLYDLMDDTFDGKDSDKSYLAYCLDAQRMQWKHNLRRYYP